jgi:hypothetical protein
MLEDIDQIISSFIKKRDKLEEKIEKINLVILLLTLTFI